MMKMPLQKPNWFHRILQRIVMLEPVTRFFSSRIRSFDRSLYSATQGHYTFTSLLIGLPVIMVTLVGRKTGREYTIPLVGIIQRETLAIIASNFGMNTYPAWYYNLVANPIVTVSINGKKSKYRARIADHEEYQELWGQAVAIYPGYEEYQKRAGKRDIPIFILSSIHEPETSAIP